jgi:hypothetical protein
VQQSHDYLLIRFDRKTMRAAGKRNGAPKKLRRGGRKENVSSSNQNETARRNDLSRRAAYAERLGFGFLFLRLGADDTTADTDAGRYYHVKATAVLVRPYGSDFNPCCLTVAAFFRLYDHVGAVCWFSHDSFSFVLLARDCAG